MLAVESALLIPQNCEYPTFSKDLVRLLLANALDSA